MAYDHLEIEARWGTILGEDNERMSKSRGNVVNPDDIGREYGADGLRLYEMFMGALEAVKPWQTSQIQGVSGFGPLWLSLGATSWVIPGVDAEPQVLNPPQGAARSGCSARSSGAVLHRVVAIEMAADRDAQPRTVRRPRCVWYQRIGRW